jgi:hypothetical protein
VIAMHHSFEELTFFTGEILNGSASQNEGSSNQIDAGKVIQNLSKWLIKPLKFDQSSFGITSGKCEKVHQFNLFLESSLIFCIVVKLAKFA